MQRTQAEHLDALRTRTSAKWRMFPADVLPLPVAEMDYPLADPIAEALHAAVRRSDTGYSFGSRHVAEAFAPFAERRFGWTIDPARVTGTSDVSTGIVDVLRAALQPGDPVIITPPIYSPFFHLPLDAGCTVIEVPLEGGIDEGWSLDLEGIEAAFAAGARALLLCNPHNPTGSVPDAATLATLAEIAARHDALIVADEVHGPLAQPTTPYTPFLTVSDAARDVGIAVTGATKSFNIAGLKAALIVAGDGRSETRRQAIPEASQWRMSQFGAIASIAAFEHGDPWLDGVLASLDDNRRLLAELLDDELPGTRYRLPDATFLAWLDLSALGWGDDPAVHALEVARVALGGGPSFGSETGRGHARLNFACSSEVLAEAVTRLADAR